MVKPVWNNPQRVNHQNFARITHPGAKKNIVPRAVLMKSGLVSVNTARQVNVAHSKTIVNAARPMSYLSKTTHSTVKRPIHKNTTFKNSNFNQRVNTVKDKNINTVRPKAVVNAARPKAVVNAVKGNNVNAVKALACWVWKPKTKVLDHVSKHNSASITLKKFDYMFLKSTSCHQSPNRSLIILMTLGTHPLSVMALGSPLIESAIPSTLSPNRTIKSDSNGDMIYRKRNTVIFKSEALYCFVISLAVITEAFSQLPLTDVRCILNNVLDGEATSGSLLIKAYSHRRNLQSELLSERYKFFKSAAEKLKLHGIQRISQSIGEDCFSFMEDQEMEDQDVLLSSSNLDHLGKFDGKVDEGFFVGYYVLVKALEYSLVEQGSGRKTCIFRNIVYWFCRLQPECVLQVNAYERDRTCQKIIILLTIMDAQSTHISSIQKSFKIMDPNLKWLDEKEDDHKYYSALEDISIFDSQEIIKKLVQRLNEQFGYNIKSMFESDVSLIFKLTSCLLYVLCAKIMSIKDYTDSDYVEHIFDVSKKIFGNMKMVGKGFSGRVTPLFPTMVVHNLEEMGEGSTMPTDPHRTPTVIQPSTSQPQKTQTPKRPKRKDTEATPNEPSSPRTSSGGGPRRQEPMGDTIAQTRSENVSKLSNDPLIARVLALETTKTTQANEIAGLKRRVKKIERRNKSRTHGLKILYKVGSSRRVESSDKQGLGEEDASKRGRIADIDVNKDIYLVNVHTDEDMFGVNDIDGDEVIMDHVDVVKTAEETINAVVTIVSTASTIPVSAATTTTTTTAIVSDVEITLAQALAELKSAKPKANKVVKQEPEQVPTPTVSSQQPSQVKVQDKGKGKMVEPKSVKKMSKKDLLRLDEELAFKLQAKEEEEEERLAREKAQEIEEVNIAWDDVQAKIDDDYQLAQRLQA
ncbi:hypothetical protein Tco_1254125 [Tanacetum coccineum]